MLCNEREVEAVIDTGAAVTVISPQLAQNLACSLAAWDGPKIIMANGEEGVELGQTELTITDGDRKAEGKALVMKMKGVDLLLGNKVFSDSSKMSSFNTTPRNRPLILGRILLG